MPLFSKTLLKTGVYRAPQGRFDAAPGRLRMLVDKFRRMKEAGILVPVSWGHAPHAEPADDEQRAEQQFWLSKFNAGYLRDLSLSADGKLDGKLDVPDVELKGGDLVHWIRLEDGRQVRGKVGEVSIAVKPWTDGRGKDWGESLVHVALSPHPVGHGAGGFRLSAAATAAPMPPPSAACTADGSGFTLSLAQMTSTLSASSEGRDVADEDSDMDKKGDDAEGGDSKADHFKEGLQVLAKRGLGLPDDTTPENFWERLVVAGHALEHAEDTTGEDMDGMDDDEGEGAVYDGDADNDGSPDAVQETRPVMMSLADDSLDATAKAGMRRTLKEHKASLERRIERLRLRGAKPALLADLRKELEGYSPRFTLSAADDGEQELAVVPRRLDTRIRDLEASLPARHPAKGLRTARLAPRPDANGERNRVESDEEIKRRAEAVGRRK